MDVEPDGIAVAVGEALSAAEYAGSRSRVVSFTGWVGAGASGTTRLYSNARLTVWLEIPDDMIVHQLKGSDRPHDDGRSVIWVYAEAILTACRRATAETVADVTPETPDETHLEYFKWPPKP